MKHAVLLLLALPSPQDVTLFASDFEQDDGGLFTVGGQDWEWGMPTAGPGAAHSGARCWGTNLDGAVTVGQDVLVLPTLDATAAAAAGADAVVVRWWQWFDEPPLVAYPYHVTTVRAASSGHSQDLFGRIYFSWSTHLAYDGWHEVVCVLGEEYMGGALDITISDQASGTEGMYLDDVSVEALKLTEVSHEDFEAGPGGFSGTWSYGPITGCPVPVTVPSGVNVWATAPGGCSYFNGATLVSPVIDLVPYRGLEVFLRWDRFAYLETVWDGVYHELSYDGGPWEVGAGYHDRAFAPGFFGYTSYGVGVDPMRGDTVQVRWRVHTDMSDIEDGMWIDDFALAVRRTIPGSGANPAGSLTVSAGDFTIGAATELAIVDPPGPLGAFGAPALSALAIALAGDPGLPMGTPIPGYGLAPGTSGDLLVSLAAFVDVVPGTAWSPGVPAKVTVNVPNQPALAGLAVFLQAVLIDVAGADVGLTNGLFIVPVG